MLGRFGFAANLETRLARPNVKVEELFEDDQFLHQVQLQNPKLIDFLRRPYVLSQLINYMTQTPPTDHPKAATACEILAAGIPALMDSLVFNHPELLTVFWALLDQPYTLDSQLTYFCKVNHVLLIKRPADMLRFIQSQPDIVQKWIKHLSDSAGPYLSDLLLTLIQCEQHPDCVGVLQASSTEKKEGNWLIDNDLLLFLVHRLDPFLDEKMHVVAQQVLCDIVSQAPPPNILLDHLTSRPMMAGIADYILDPAAPHAADSFISGTVVLIHLIRLRGDMDGLLDNILYTWTARLSDLLSILDHPRSGKHMAETTTGVHEKLGMERLAACQLFSELIFCANHSVKSDHGVIFKQALIKHDGLQRFLLLNEGRLMQRILEAQEENQDTGFRGRFRVGYMGHLTLISKDIIELLKSDNDISDSLDMIPWDAWNTYAAQVLEEMQQNEIPLGVDSVSDAQTK
ncbi:hypothetical protein DFQ28_005437 [Apophysomyces sp. BC1034]|nr:hypothetical protein DFQ28_005437 [Apophysomyces sp. BC1034]